MCSRRQVLCSWQDSHTSCHNKDVRWRPRHTLAFSCSALDDNLFSNLSTAVREYRLTSHLVFAPAPVPGLLPTLEPVGKPGNVLGAAHALEQYLKYRPVIGFCACGWDLHFWINVEMRIRFHLPHPQNSVIKVALYSQHTSLALGWRGSASLADSNANGEVSASLIRPFSLAGRVASVADEGRRRARCSLPLTGPQGLVDKIIRIRAPVQFSHRPHFRFLRHYSRFEPHRLWLRV